MAPPPEYDKEPKAPDKSASSISCEETKVLHSLVNDQHNNTDSKTATVTANSEAEDDSDQRDTDRYLSSILEMCHDTIDWIDRAQVAVETEHRKIQRELEECNTDIDTESQSDSSPPGDQTASPDDVGGVADDNAHPARDEPVADSAPINQENKHVEALDDGQLRALLDEAITYKCPKDREGKSSLFKELLEEVEQDEQACEAAARNLKVGRRQRNSRGGGARHSVAQSNSLQDLVAALAAEPAPRRHQRHHNTPPATTVSARAYHGGSLPSGVDTSFLLGEESSTPRGANYLATVRCVNPPPLSERRVSTSDAPHDDTRRPKPAFPMTYTARATLEIGSGGVSAGRATTTTTASNQVRTTTHCRAPPPTISLLAHASCVPHHATQTNTTYQPMTQEIKQKKTKQPTNTPQGSMLTLMKHKKPVKLRGDSNMQPNGSTPTDTAYQMMPLLIKRKKPKQQRGYSNVQPNDSKESMEFDQVILSKKQKKKRAVKQDFQRPLFKKYPASYSCPDYKRPPSMGPPERVNRLFCSGRNPRLYYPKSRHINDKFDIKGKKDDVDENIVTKMIKEPYLVNELDSDDSVNNSNDGKDTEKTVNDKETEDNSEVNRNLDAQCKLLSALMPKTVGDKNGGGGNTKATNKNVTQTKPKVHILKYEEANPRRQKINIKKKCYEFISNVVNKPKDITVPSGNVEAKSESSKVAVNKKETTIAQAAKKVQWVENSDNWYTDQTNDGALDWADDVNNWYSNLGLSSDSFYGQYDSYQAFGQPLYEDFRANNKFIPKKSANYTKASSLKPIRDWSKFYSAEKIATKVPTNNDNNTNEIISQKKPVKHDPYRWNQNPSWIANYPNTFVRRVTEDIYRQQYRRQAQQHYRELIGESLVKPDSTTWNSKNVRSMTIGKPLSQYEDFDVTSLHNEDITDKPDNNVCQNSDDSNDKPATGYEAKIFEYLALSFKEQFKIEKRDNDCLVLNAPEPSTTLNDPILDDAVQCKTEDHSSEHNKTLRTDALHTLINKAAIEASESEDEHAVENNEVKPQDENVEDIPSKTETESTDTGVKINDSVNVEDSSMGSAELVIPKNLINEAIDIPSNSGGLDEIVDSTFLDVTEGNCDSVTFVDISTFDRSTSCLVENVTEPVAMPPNSQQECVNTDGIVVADIREPNANETGIELVDLSSDRRHLSDCTEKELVGLQTEESNEGIPISQSYAELCQRLYDSLELENSNVVNKDNSDSVLGLKVEEVHNCDGLEVEENLCLRNETLQSVEYIFFKDVNNVVEVVPMVPDGAIEIYNKSVVNSETQVPKEDKTGEQDCQDGSGDVLDSNAVILPKPDCDEETHDSSELQAVEPQNYSYIVLDCPIRLITVDSSMLVVESSPYNAESQLSRVRPKKKIESTQTKKEAIYRNILRKILFGRLSNDRSDQAATEVQEVDSAIPFSCITTPEVVASCNTTASTQAPLAVDSKPRSVISSSFNGLPLARPSYGTMSTTEEYKKPLDENGNSVQSFSSPLSGSSQHKKPRRKKSSKNETVIKSHQIDGYQGNKDLNEVLRFIESNADAPRSNGPKLRKSRHEDEDKPKKRERRKDKQPPQRAASLEEIAVSSLRELTTNRPPPAKPERRSWGDDFRTEDEPGEFQTVTKKRRWRRRELSSATPLPAAPRPRRVSAPPSDRSDSNDDDSVHSLHSLPALNAGEPGRSVASYAEIARAANIPDLIESCNFYLEEPARSAPPPPPPPPHEYPALEPRRRAAAVTNKPPHIPPKEHKKERKRVEGVVSPPEQPEPVPVAPDVVGRPAVILLDSARHQDIAGITFGFDINEQLLADGLSLGGCDLVLTALPTRVRYVPPPPPAAHIAPQLTTIVQYVADAWEDVMRCKVRYYSE